MKKYILLIILMSAMSCKENKIKTQEKENSKKVIDKKIVTKKLDDDIQEIGNLYRPEIMQEGEIRSKTDKNNYQYTLINSDLLDNDLKNIKVHARKIVRNYYNFLIRINSPFNYCKIIVKIVHRNGKIDSFEYSEKEMKEITKE